MASTLLRTGNSSTLKAQVRTHARTRARTHNLQAHLPLGRAPRYGLQAAPCLSVADGPFKGRRSSLQRQQQTLTCLFELLASSLASAQPATLHRLTAPTLTCHPIRA